MFEHCQIKHTISDLFPAGTIKNAAQTNDLRIVFAILDLLLKNL